jgi:hypothetical protein
MHDELLAQIELKILGPFDHQSLQVIQKINLLGSTDAEVRENLRQFNSAKPIYHRFLRARYHAL